MNLLHIITPTYRQATDYARDLGIPTAAVRHITSAHQLLSTFKTEIHVLPEAMELPNYNALVAAAERRRAVLVYAEEG